MKIGEQGEAFFVVEIGDETERGQIPDDLVTSPILSAANSPIVSPGLDPISPPTTSHADEGKAAMPADVEPFYLDASGSPTKAVDQSNSSDAGDTASVPSSSVRNRSTETVDTIITTWSESRGSSMRPDKLSQGGAADAACAGGTNASDDPAPPDSAPERSAKSLLGQLGSAASKAGGAVGAVGRAVGVKADNPRLNELTEQAGREDRTGAIGAAVEQDKQDAHEYDPCSSISPGKQRPQRANDESPPNRKSTSGPKRPVSETERLELEMKNKAEHLIHDEESLLTGQADQQPVETGSSAHEADDALHQSGAGNSSGENEEACPAPFSETFLRSYPKVGGSEARSTSNAFPIARKNHQHCLAGRKLPSNEAAAELGVKPSQVDVRTTQGRVRAEKAQLGPREDRQVDNDVPASRAKLAQEEFTDSQEFKVNLRKRSASSSSGRKEDFQYLFDMDGYKMTADGEDLAFAEGHRLAEEIPLSRRHGGKEFHPHIGELLDQAHRRERKAALNRAEYEPPVSLPAPKAEGDATAPGSSSLSMPGIGRDSGGGSAAQDDDASLSQDLARLAHCLSQGNGTPDEGTSASTEPAAPQSLNESGSARKRTSRPRRHVQEVSLSDTEADRHDIDKNDSIHREDEPSSMIRRNLHHRAKSGPLGLEIPHTSRTTLPGDATPPKRLDNSLARKKGADGRWQWGEPGQRNRVLSSAAAEDAKSFDETPSAGSPRFCGSSEDPYAFRIVLNDVERTFSMSLCYKDGFGQRTPDETEREEFRDGRVSFQRFIDDPDVVNDERLVVHFNDRFLTWENSASVLATLSLYRTAFASVGSDAVLSSVIDATPSDEGPRASVWSRWWNRNKSQGPAAFEQGSSAPQDSGDTTGKAPFLVERVQSDTTLLVADTSGGSSKEAAEKPEGAREKPDETTGARKPTKTFAKTLRLTSDQLKSLNLKRGANSITFSVTSSYSGVAVCAARIFLWKASHHIVVSDIDGTITKSDALGHVFTMIGRDWTHMGVAKLYTDIVRNGYRIMYLTSRAIGQADTTRDYLKGIIQNNYRLPDGPVIMSPDRLIASLHREVILRKPEVFKMACLRDIARLFGADPRRAHPQPGALLPRAGEEPSKAAIGPVSGHKASLAEEAATAQHSSRGEDKEQTTNPTPFYAGFGNRITDALSYRSVNIPSSRIFTIDTNGEVKMELLELAEYKSSYIHMTDLVDQMFPPITQRSSEKKTGKPEFSDFNYWRPQITDFELPPDDELLPTPPVSPTLSARSGRSVRSVTGSVRSATSGVALPTEGDSQQSRLSRFGLGSLGLSRKSSVQTIAATDPSAASQPSGPRASMHAACVGDVIEGGKLTESPLASNLSLDGTQVGQSADSVPTESNGDGNFGVSSSSYGSGTTSWMAPWRRRAASPGAGPSSPPQATSPLVGPVITPEPESEDDGYDEDDDDVSSFEGKSEDEKRGDGGKEFGGGGQDEEDYDDELSEDDAEAAAGRSDQRRAACRSDPPHVTGEGGVRPPGRGRRRAYEASGEGVESGFGDNVLDEDVDELLASGEVRFDWRG